MFGHTDNQHVNNQPIQSVTPDPAMSSDQIMHDGSLEEQSTFASTQSGTQNPITNGLSEIPGVAAASPTPFSPPTPPEPSAQSDFSSPTPPATDNTSVDGAVPTEDLLDLKQQALQELSPLVGQLEQTPEEKFRTTMMMIQASDDQSLLPEAYRAAQAITEEKAKAQALLDVINEINYFTQSH